MEDSIAVRLKKFISYLGTNDSNFADACGISRSTLSLILSGRNKKISDQQIAQIHRAYPELSVVWLLFGEGAMIIKDTGEGQSAEITLKSDDEISEISPITGVEFENSNLSALNRAENLVNQLQNKQITLQEKIQNLELKISKMESEPRRVTKITIFYDDSTFETFTPER